MKNNDWVRMQESVYQISQEEWDDIIAKIDTVTEVQPLSTQKFVDDSAIILIADGKRTILTQKPIL